MIHPGIHPGLVIRITPRSVFPCPFRIIADEIAADRTADIDDPVRSGDHPQDIAASPQIPLYIRGFRDRIIGECSAHFTSCHIHQAIRAYGKGNRPLDAGWQVDHSKGCRCRIIGEELPRRGEVSRARAENDTVDDAIRCYCQPGDAALVRDRPAQILYGVRFGIIHKEVGIIFTRCSVSVTCAAIYPSIGGSGQVVHHNRISVNLSAEIHGLSQIPGIGIRSLTRIPCLVRVIYGKIGITYGFTIMVPLRPGATAQIDQAIRSCGHGIAFISRISQIRDFPGGRIVDKHVPHIHASDIGCVNVGHMFVYDPATGEITDLGNPGYECNAMTTGTDGLIYLGGGTRSEGDHDCKSIGYANFAIYDPDKAWNPGEGPDANPRNLGQAVNFSGEVDGYPIVVHDLATAPDGRIYGCTGYRDGTSGEYYAHLFVYDPETDSIENLGRPISNQSSITRLAIAPDGIIYGVILGPRTGYFPPPGKLFSYNPASASFAMINLPSSIEGAVALTVGTDGLVYVAGGEMSTTFTYDPVSKSSDIKGNLGGCSDVLRMITAADGIIYIGCAVSGYFVRYDPERAWEDRPWSDANDKPGVNPRMYHYTGKVNALTEGKDGIIYFGNLSGELYNFAGEEVPSS